MAIPYNIDLDQFLRRTGGTMTGALMLPSDPLLPLEAASKSYVDAIAASMPEPIPLSEIDELFD